MTTSKRVSELRGTPMADSACARIVISLFAGRGRIPRRLPLRADCEEVSGGVRFVMTDEHARPPPPGWQGIPGDTETPIAKPPVRGHGRLGGLRVHGAEPPEPPPVGGIKTGHGKKFAQGQ